MADNIFLRYARTAQDANPQNALAASSRMLPPEQWSLPYDTKPYRNVYPNLNALSGTWRAHAMSTDEADSPLSRLSAFSAPPQLAPVQPDRISSNVEEAGWQQGLINALMWTPARNLVGLLSLPRPYLEPRVTMREVGNMLPKDTTPYMGR